MNYDDKIEEAQFAASLLLLVVGLRVFQSLLGPEIHGPFILERNWPYCGIVRFLVRGSLSQRYE